MPNSDLNTSTQEQTNAPESNQPIPNNSDVSIKLEQVIKEIQEDRKIQQEKDKQEQQEKEGQLKEKEKQEQIQKEKDEKSQQDKDTFLKDFNKIVQSSTTGTDTTFQETVNQKLDELIFLKKMDFMSVGLFMSILLVLIFQISFKR